MAGLRVLSWNLMHGRAVPGAGHDLLGEFGDALAGWPWDVALLQEVPPWWPPALAVRTQAAATAVRTSRHELLPLRRAVAIRVPDLIKSNGGGANAVLLRTATGETIAEHRTLRLTRWPERRWLHAVRLEPSGRWIGNLHLTVHDDARARREAACAGEVLRGWAGHAPAILGGDFNLRRLRLDGYAQAGRSDVDQVFVRRGPDVGAAGLRAGRATVTLEHGTLSDHAPLLVNLD